MGVKKGDRIEFTEQIKKQFPNSKMDGATVIGIEEGFFVRVRRDGIKKTELYHPRFLIKS